MNTKTQRLVTLSLVTAILCIFSPLALPSPSGVPITLQTFVLALAAYLLKPKQAMTCLLLYYLLGIIGLPVFAGFRGSIASFTGPTGGFLLGFSFLVFLASLGLTSKKKWLSILLSAAGLLACHFLGIIYYSFLSHTGFLTALATVSLPYIIKDVASLVLAYLVAKTINKRLVLRDL